MSADSPRRTLGNASRGLVAVPAIVPPQVVSDRSILDSAIGFINEVTLAHQPHTDPKDTITWARFETAADISDPRFGEDWELEGNVSPPLLLILGYGLGVQVWAIPANGEAVEVLSWRHGIVSALRVLPTPSSAVAIEENGRADEPIDAFAEKRPLIALVDGSSSSGAQPQFCAVNFISLKTGTQVKAIKFKNPVIDVLANRSSIVITFHERIAIFDARTLEDRLSITTCYPSPGINPNPIALGPRWLAYAEHKLLHSKRSGGGCDGEGVASYTATVLNASKSLVKGLRELGEQVAAGLTGTSGSTASSKNTSFDSGTGPDSKQSGIVTIIDIKNPLRDYSPTSGVPMSSGHTAGTDPIVAHFIAHSEALVSMEFDNSGMLLVTADRRGHDFHVFRIQPNPVGASLAAVHHLYVLHRGDTSAKVQNISFSLDSRWVAVSTLRGTTHVFPITPYGGPMGVRTHTSLHVVNKLSRFHRSAGLSAEGRSNSPISHSESTTFSLSLQPYHNTTLPPYPRPTVVMPLAQLRQPFALGSPPGSATLAGGKSGPGGGPGSGSQRQRLSSLSDDSGKPLSVCAIFAKSRSWLLDPPNVTREAPHRMQRKAVDSLFVMAGHGALIQYDLDTKLASNVAKEKICDDTPIELEVEAKAQWNLGRRKEGSQEIMPPLSLDNWLVKSRNSCMLTDSTRQYDDSDDRGDSWLAQVEIVTHAGPHRRLWMGPQFVFKTYNTPSGSNLSHVDIEAVEIGTNNKSTTTTPAATTKPEHSSPLNMPLTAAGRSSAVPVLIESGSYSSIEQSPKLMDRFRHDHLDSDYSVAHGDTRLKEDLADAMRESPSVSAASKESGCRGCETGCSSDNIAFYDALAEHDDQDQEPDFLQDRHASAAALASALPNIHSYDNSSSYESIESLKKPKVSIEKIVNPLGTVTTVTSCLTADVKKDILDEVVSQLAAEDTVIHENCDESLFRPVVAIFCDEKTRLKQEEDARKNQELCQPPENISNKLIVPVIAKEVDDALNKKEKQKNISKFKNLQSETKAREEQQSKFEELSSLNRKSKVTASREQEEEKAIISREKQATLESERNKNDSKDSEKRTAESKAVKVAKEAETTSKQSTKLTKVSEEATAKESEKSRKTNEMNESVVEKTKASGDKSKAGKESEGSKTKLTAKESEKIKPILAEESDESTRKPAAKETKPESNNANRKDRQRKSEERESVERVIEKSEIKESVKMVAESKSSKPSSEKRNTPEKEKSPKPVASKKATAKAPPIDESEEDKPIEFMRMTPAVAAEEKTSSQKPLSKKELKKQQQQLQQQKAKEEEAKTFEAEKTKKKLEKESEPTTLVAKEKDSAEVKTTPAKEVKKVDSDKPQEAETDDDKSSETKEIKMKEESIAEPPQSAVKTAIIREEVTKAGSLSKVKDEITKPAKAEMKSIIKTEQLNVKDLADSLIELKYEDNATEDKQEEEVEKTSTPILETVDIFTAPAAVKPSKKNKKKGNKSGSSSENEEVVDVTKPASASSSSSSTTKVKEEPMVSKKKSSDDSSNTDLADRLLERKDYDDMEETMFISFAQIEERRKSKENLNIKQNKKNERENKEKETEMVKEEQPRLKGKIKEVEDKESAKDQQELVKRKDQEVKSTDKKSTTKLEHDDEKVILKEREPTKDKKLTEYKVGDGDFKEKSSSKVEELQSKDQTKIKSKAIDQTKINEEAELLRKSQEKSIAIEESDKYEEDTSKKSNQKTKSGTTSDVDKEKPLTSKKTTDKAARESEDSDKDKTIASKKATEKVSGDHEDKDKTVASKKATTEKAAKESEDNDKEKPSKTTEKTATQSEDSDKYKTVTSKKATDKAARDSEDSDKDKTVASKKTTGKTEILTSKKATTEKVVRDSDKEITVASRKAAEKAPRDSEDSDKDRTVVSRKASIEKAARDSEDSDKDKTVGLKKTTGKAAAMESEDSDKDKTVTSKKTTEKVSRDSEDSDKDKTVASKKATGKAAAAGSEDSDKDKTVASKKTTGKAAATESEDSEKDKTVTIASKKTTETAKDSDKYRTVASKKTMETAKDSGEDSDKDKTLTIVSKKTTEAAKDSDKDRTVASKKTAARDSEDSDKDKPVASKKTLEKDSTEDSDRVKTATTASKKTETAKVSDKDKTPASKRSTEKSNDSEESDKERQLTSKANRQTEDSTNKVEVTSKKSETKVFENLTKNDNKNKTAEKKSESQKNTQDSKEMKINKTEKEPPLNSSTKKSADETEKSETKSKEKDTSEAKATIKEKERVSSSPLKKETVVVEQQESDRAEQRPVKMDSNASKATLKNEVVTEQPRRQEKSKKEEPLKKETPNVECGIEKKKQQAVLAATKETLKNKTTPPSSPKKKEEPERQTSLTTKTADKPKVSQEEFNKWNKTKTEKKEEEAVTEDDNKKTTWAAISKPDKKLESDVSKNKEEYKIKVTENWAKDATDSGKTAANSPKKSTTETATPPPPVPIVSAWNTLSGADMITKKLSKQEIKPDNSIFPSLGAIAKTSRTSTTTTTSDKLLPELPTPKEMKEPLVGCAKTSAKKPRNSSALDDFPILKPLDELPPLPTLEPLELIAAGDTRKDISLINFESPLQENPALERKITPPPRGFTEQNLIFALCGSLHYENEQRARVTPDRSDVSPTTPSSNRSSSALDEPSMADYKSLTENDDPYVSLEQSSQDTYTTNTNTTNDKFSSSTNSSGTEEIIIMEEKKMTKKQKRKRQQQLLELQKQKEQQLQQQHHHTTEMDDDELRPLIGMSESQIETIAAAGGGEANNLTSMTSLLDESFCMKPLITKSNTLSHSTTTDSEGPMPATTSDDNVFIMPAAAGGHIQHKIKTKKLEHKINLLAAIEAATSSSTSSAEESGVELGGGRSMHDADDQPPLSPSSLISAAAGLVGGTAASSSSVLPLSMAAVVAAGGGGISGIGAPPMALSSTAGALKKKTKRRFQFNKEQGNDNVDGMDKMRNKLNNKKSTTDSNNSNHDSNTTAAATSMKKKILGDRRSCSQMSQDATLPPHQHHQNQQQQQQEKTDTHNSSIYEMKQHQQQNNTASIQYLTHNAVDNCFGNNLDAMATSETTTAAAAVGAGNNEAATIVNIDIFDDQLSTSSISNTSRFSCETAPLTTTTPPISLNGVIDTNLMHFSAATGKAAASATEGNKLETSGTTNSSSSSSLAHNERQRANYRRGGGGRGGGGDDDDDDGDDDGNSSNSSAGSL